MQAYSVMMQIGVFVSIIGISGCDGESPSGGSTTVVVVSEDTTLDRDMHNTQFRIRGNGTDFNLNGHTLSFDTDGNHVILEAGYIGHGVSNGRLVGKHFGNGIYIASNVMESDVPKLNQSIGHESVIYSRSSHNPFVRDMIIEGFNNGIYVSSYIVGADITNNRITKADNVGLYLDTATTGSTVTGNTFSDNGWREADSPFARKRGHLSVDASYDNTITVNTFTDTKYKWALFGGGSNYPAPMIELYRNCGEGNSDWTTHPVLPRLHGADSNVISGNNFNGKGLAIWFAYRRHNNICNPVIYPDKADGNVATGNFFAPNVEHVRDDGVGNIY